VQPDRLPEQKGKLTKLIEVRDLLVAARVPVEKLTAAEL